MKSAQVRALLLSLAFFLCGCASVPTAQLDAEAARVGYGAPLPADWQARIREFVGAGLKDPYSAVYKFGEPRPGWVAKPAIRGGGLDAAGYIVAVEVNAKNSFGAYVGAQEWQFLIRDGQVIRHAKRVGDLLFWE